MVLPFVLTPAAILSLSIWNASLRNISGVEICFRRAAAYHTEAAKILTRIICGPGLIVLGRQNCLASSG